ncbi:hypothetical protein CPB84DRAFT_1848153 [Gymnopilus junonius]|uniref:Uncharacterized protein n=1 Tax=Gymnopilus junonius TaxID=109634 RepID=A0A9P5TL47_GYMJU|nr:hypothetical protein CPB84DRAFT_1848153 [Gymnopilus junonius]
MEATVLSKFPVFFSFMFSKTYKAGVPETGKTYSKERRFRKTKNVNKKKKKESISSTFKPHPKPGTTTPIPIPILEKSQMPVHSAKDPPMQKELVIGRPSSKRARVCRKPPSRKGTRRRRPASGSRSEGPPEKELVKRKSSSVAPPRAEVEGPEGTVGRSRRLGLSEAPLQKRKSSSVQASRFRALRLVRSPVIQSVLEFVGSPPPEKELVVGRPVIQSVLEFVGRPPPEKELIIGRPIAQSGFSPDHGPSAISSFTDFDKTSTVAAAADAEDREEADPHFPDEGDGLDHGRAPSYVSLDDSMTDIDRGCPPPSYDAACSVSATTRP